MSNLIISGQSWASLKEQTSMLVKSGFLPKGIDTAEKAIAIALKGHEMGIPPMQAFSHISIINGKPCISSELMLAQIYRNVPGAKIEILENTEERAVISATRPGEKPSKFSFAMDDARRANLTGKSTWAQYPRIMLMWRAVSMMARSKFPDAIMGCSYTPEEMGAEVEIGEDGQILEIKEVKSEEQKKPQAPQFSVAPSLSEETVIEFDPEVPEFMGEDLGSYVIKIGKTTKGKMLREVPEKSLVWLVDTYSKYPNKAAETVEFIEKAKAFLGSK